MFQNPGVKTAALIASLGSIMILGMWYWNFAGYELSHDSVRWSEFGSYLGGTLGPILAFASFIGLLVTVQHQAEVQATQESRADSEIYRVNATECLERAFAIFTGNSESNVPISDRLVWLTAARLLNSAQSISSKIEIDSIRTMYKADEEYWRYRFYDILEPINIDNPLSDPGYFRKGEEKVSGYTIDERSIRIIYDFIEWPENQSDPLNGVARYTNEEISKMGASRYGVKTYLESLRSGT